MIKDDSISASAPSKQRRWQLRQIAQGNCPRCGRTVDEGRTICRRCRRLIRISARRRTGSKPWREGYRGRPPIGAKRKAA